MNIVNVSNNLTPEEAWKEDEAFILNLVLELVWEVMMYIVLDMELLIFQMLMKMMKLDSSATDSPLVLASIRYT